MRNAGAPNLWRIVARVLVSYMRMPQFWFWSPIVVVVAVFISSSWPLRLILEGAPADEDLLHNQLVISVLFLCGLCAFFSAFVTGHMARLLALPHNHVVPNIRGPVMGVTVVLTLLGIFLPVIFWPRPEVDSAVVRIDTYDQPIVDVPDNQTFFRVVRAGFGQKRKQLKNSLASGLNMDADQTAAVFDRSKIDSRRRAETLTLEEWALLTRAYHALNA